MSCQHKVQNSEEEATDVQNYNAVQLNEIQLIACT